MRVPPFFWPLTLMFLAAADIGMTTGHPPVGVFSLLLPALVVVAAAVSYVLGNGRETLGVAAASALAVVLALAGYGLGYALPPYGLLVALVALVVAGLAASTIWLKSKGEPK